MIKLFKQNNRGFTLVETLIAISIFTISIVALMSVLGQGISNTTYAKEKIIASYLAQEGIEYIRNMRDTYVLYTAATTNDWTKFKTKVSPCTSGSSCGFDNSVFPPDVFACSTHNSCKLYLNNGNYNNNLIGSDSGFVRKIVATVVSADEVKVTSSVFWTQGSGSYRIDFSESLFNWVE